ncbi:MAG: PSD1 and planctomycete cytochrome C domain-containing protein [Planctomycetaceae bacterium]
MNQWSILVVRKCLNAIRLCVGCCQVSLALLIAVTSIVLSVPGLSIPCRADESMNNHGGGRLRFDRDVLPILSDKCFQCHGPDAKEGRQGNLRLDDEADARRDRNGYRVIDSDHPEESEMIRRIFSNDSDLKMPPEESGRRLTDAQQEILRQWILEGSPWGTHWALERIERPEINALSGIHPIDQLVGRIHSARNIQPVGSADGRILIRRLSLDLTGLPPTPDHVQQYMEDTSPEAWAHLVDRTLASPAFGERMAWDWLEAARYADSNGYQGDNDRTMWPWRDWVIDAFNRNLPYDKFTLWQLAGDLLPEPTEEQILATAFNRNHMINGEGGRIAEENRVDYVMDMTETMGTVWLGLTLNCCRCHDHKFDPLSQRDYYQFTAFFNQTPVNGGGGNAQTPPVLSFASDEQKRRLAELEEQLSVVDNLIAERASKLQSTQQDWEATFSKSSKADWSILHAHTATALHQKLETDASGLILASGTNPPKDEYTLEFDPSQIASNQSPDTLHQISTIASIRLDAVRHPTMTSGGLARSDSGNFVLTDFEVQLRDAENKTTQRLTLRSPEATFEQGNLKIANAIDSDPASGWAIWNGKTIDRDHSAVFRFVKPFSVSPGSTLIVKLKFNSPHANHNLGHFRLLVSPVSDAAIDGSDNALVQAIQTPVSRRNAEQQALIQKRQQADDEQFTALQKQKAELRKQSDQLTKGLAKVMVMEDRQELRKTFVLDRGLYNQPGDEVMAAGPVSLPSIRHDEGTLADSASHPPLNRRHLAQWLVSRDHPLTARVTVNRYWQMLFGIGLVKTAEDFGVQGEYPIQRELLDWLAAEFIESGWDVKHLLRTIVTSETYKRRSNVTSSEVFEADPENRFLARGSRFRMPSWMIRDQALAVSGLLVDKRGGPSVYPYQPEGVWSEATFGKRTYAASTGDALYRRSLYSFWRRIIGPPIFFDSARRQVCEVKPLRTNTPMHALTLLNDVTYVEAARTLAQLALTDVPRANLDSDKSESENTSARMQFISQRVLCRPIGPSELSVWQRSLNRALTAFEASPDSAQQLISVGESARDSSIPAATHAAWTALCLNILNLDETLTRE